MAHPLAEALSTARETTSEALAEAEAYMEDSGDDGTYKLVDEALSSIEAAQAKIAAATR